MAQETKPSCFPAVTVHPEPNDITCNQGGRWCMATVCCPVRQCSERFRRSLEFAHHVFCWQCHTLKQAALSPDRLSDIRLRAVGIAKHLASSCYRKRLGRSCKCAQRHASRKIPEQASRRPRLNVLLGSALVVSHSPRPNTDVRFGHSRLVSRVPASPSKARERKTTVGVACHYGRTEGGGWMRRPAAWVRSRKCEFS